MTIASVGTLGTGANSTSNASYTFVTATNSLASGDFGILVSTSDNTSTGADGDYNEHTSVSGGTGTWTKLDEFGNNNGAAGAGVVTSLWLFKATGTVNTGTTITLNFSSNRTDKCCSFWKFTKAAGTSIIIDAEPATNPQTSASDGANNFAAASFSALTSRARLYFRGASKEANSTTQITTSANFNAISVSRSRNNASAVLTRGEFRINTSTGETSSPTLAVVGDTACLFAALIEAPEALSGTAAGTSTASGAVTGFGALAGTVTGTSTATGALDQPISPISGTAAGTSIATGTLGGAGGLYGAASGVSTASATLGASGELIGAVAGTSSATGALTGFGALAGSVTATSTAVGTLGGVGGIAGLASGTSTATGTLEIPLSQISGNAHGTSAATGALTGDTSIAGVAVGSSTATGTLAGDSIVTSSVWWTDDERIYFIPTDERVLFVPYESRLAEVDAAPRLAVVAYESRITQVPKALRITYI